LISRWIGDCQVDVKNHGKFVRCVAKLTKELKKAGVIPGKEKGPIQSCAAQADIPISTPHFEAPKFATLPDLIFIRPG
jgi:hypothetical protein